MFDISNVNFHYPWKSQSVKQMGLGKQKTLRLNQF